MSIRVYVGSEEISAIYDLSTGKLVASGPHSEISDILYHQYRIDIITNDSFISLKDGLPFEDIEKLNQQAQDLSEKEHAAWKAEGDREDLIAVANTLTRVYKD